MTNTSQLPLLVIVDDSLVVRLAWRAKNQHAFVVTLIDSPEDFFTKFPDSATLRKIQTVICDYHFDNSQKSGRDVVAYIKGQAPRVKVYLSSFAALKDTVSGVDGVLDKDAIDLSSGSEGKR